MLLSSVAVLDQTLHSSHHFVVLRSGRWFLKAEGYKGHSSRQGSWCIRFSKTVYECLTEPDVYMFIVVSLSAVIGEDTSGLDGSRTDSS